VVGKREHHDTHLTITSKSCYSSIITAAFYSSVLFANMYPIY